MTHYENQILSKMNRLNLDQRNDVIDLIEEFAQRGRNNFYRRRAMQEIRDALTGEF